MKKDLRKKAIENTAEGTAKQVSGRIRNASGALRGKPTEQIKGKAKELEGKAQTTLGKLQGKAAARRTTKPREAGADSDEI